ncbi:Tetratricopeptide-like helical domain containing protein [Parasponia andersonii]|uniref:Tetratricopeptide-like helical domain containing protein n=1 Tax=Parasponia andersonii TaxID=3476 RepID=A0A2P5BMP5_PARAD|nr:Tetratricopeptide-like helical domain containing protein [Parasponia andersonii]
MPIIIVTSKTSYPPITYLVFFKLKLVRPFSSSSSSSSGGFPAPTHHHIAHLILDQNSPSQALQTFRWASNLPNFIHSQSTYRALIHKLCSFRCFGAVHNLLDEMPTSIASPPDDDTFLTLIRGLARARMTPQLVQLPDLVSRFHGCPSLKILNSVLNVLVKDNIDVARAFYRRKMMATGVVGDHYTFAILMKGLCSTNRIADAFKLLQLLKSRGVTPNAVIYNTLLHALCRNGKVGRARSLMNDMEKPTDITFNLMISAYCAQDNLIQALVLLDKCFSFGLVPDIVTVTKVLEILCNLGRVSEAVEILERLETEGGAVDVVAYNTLIKGFCKLGKVKVGHRILKEMEGKGCLPSVETYNVLISGLCEVGMLDSALDLFNDMKTDGVKGNFATHDTLIRGLCSVGRTDDGFQILKLMEESREGCGGRISPYNSIIYALYKQKRTEEALEFLTNMGKLFPRVVGRSLRVLDLCKEQKTKDAKIIYDQMISEGGVSSVLVYDCLIHGFCYEGCLREAFELMNKMIDHGSSPIASTINALICGFCSQGKTDSAIRFMEDMVGRGCMLNAGSYSPLLLAVCREGDFPKALKIISEMIENGITPDYLAWNSLLLCLSQETEWLENNHMLHVNKLLD